MEQALAVWTPPESGGRGQHAKGPCRCACQWSSGLGTCTMVTKLCSFMNSCRPTLPLLPVSYSLRAAQQREAQGAAVCGAGGRGRRRSGAAVSMQ